MPEVNVPVKFSKKEITDILNEKAKPHGGNLVDKPGIGTVTTFEIVEGDVVSATVTFNHKTK